MEVAWAESLGSDDLVTFERDGWQVTARNPGPGVRLKSGQLVHVGFRMDKSHLFDQDTGLALAGSGPDG
jgi:hypothetical protein